MLPFFVFWVWLVLVIAYLGLMRLSLARRQREDDWEELVRFGTAVDALRRARFADSDARAIVIAMAPRMRQVLAGRHSGSPEHTAAAFDVLDRLDPELFDVQREAFDRLQGRVYGYESFLQSEMKQWQQLQASPLAWLDKGVLALLLSLRDPKAAWGNQPGARTRRRDFEAEPRNMRAARAGTWVLLVITAVLAVAFVRAWLAMARMI